ncbi:MAG TPA: GGDEF domain-containing protein [Giesbergeria sp.]|nr:GGDEF domain-containing protein [Giesbergeria sp.]HNI75735.1 GGDEF domain-containing protein [Giesbergeria sp.]
MVSPEPANDARASTGAFARAGWLRLRFADAALEADFRRYHLAEFLPRMRKSLPVALALFLAFAMLDALSLPPLVRDGVLGLRLGGIVPVLALTWVALYVRSLREWLQWLVSASALASGLGIVGIIWVARVHAFGLPYEGIILATFFSYFLTGLRFVAASLCGWLVFLAYVAMELHVGLNGDTLLYNAFFLATANLIGCFGNHFLEQAVRQNFCSMVQMHKLAERDFVTGLLNRRAFSTRATGIWREALRDGRSIGIAMVDVDHFKHYNDHYGHAAGDVALQSVAHVIAEHARRPLDACARYGGEEFVVLWYDVDADHAMALAQRMCQAVQALGLPHVASPTAGVVSISVGLVCTAVHNAAQWDAALRAADQALYQAKQQGRNRVCAADPRTAAGG